MSLHYFIATISSFFTLFLFPTGYGMHLVLQEVKWTVKSLFNFLHDVVNHNTGCAIITGNFLPAHPVEHDYIHNWVLTEAPRIVLNLPLHLPSSRYILVKQFFCWSQHLYFFLLLFYIQEQNKMTRYWLWWPIIIDADVICTACY